LGLSWKDVRNNSHLARRGQKARGKGLNMQHKSRPGRLLVTRKEHQKIAVEKFSLSVRATTTTTTRRTRTTSTTTGSRTWLKCAHVQKCHCFGFGRKQSGEVKAKNFLFPFHTPQEAKKNLERLAHFPPLPVEVGGEKKKTEGTG